MKVTVQVPATSANLGPGFDSFGVALTLYNTITIEETACGLEITGCEKQYANCDNLVYQSYKAAMDAMGIAAKGVKIHIDADIPIARGLGSSAALLAAGAFAANALHGNPLTKAQLLQVTNPLEGHPDNLAPALFGGLTASMMDGDKPITAQCTLHPDWQFVALIPDFPLSTAAARAVLPNSYSRSDAVFNVGRGALVIKALENGDQQLLNSAMDDKIHQPYRRKLINDFDAVEKLVKGNNAAFALSGAGPTLLCVTKNSSLPEILKTELPRLTQANWTVLPLKAELNGAKTV